MKYEEWMNKLGILTNKKSILFVNVCHVYYLVDAIDPLLDSEPVDIHGFFKGSFAELCSNLKALNVLVRSGKCTTYCCMNCAVFFSPFSS